MAVAELAVARIPAQTQPDSHLRRAAQWLRSLSRRARNRLTEDGLARGSAHLFKKLVRNLVRFDSVLLFSRAQNEPIIAEELCRLPRVSIREARRKDIITFDSFYTSDRVQYKAKAREALRRFRAGYKCFLAEYEGQFIGKMWIAEVETWFFSEIETDVRIGSNSIIFLDGATIPEFRGKRVLPSLLRHINNKYPDRRRVLYCERHNIPSRRGMEHDFILEENLFLLKILGLRFRWSRRVAQAGLGNKCSET